MNLAQRNVDENKNAIEYSESIREKILGICAPLFENYGLSFFSYLRVFDNYKIFYISNDNFWVKHYISHGLMNDIGHASCLSIGEHNKYMLWENMLGENFKSNVFSAFYEANIWNGFTIKEPQEDSICYYTFAAKRNIHSLSNFYVNNINMLHQFIAYFKILAPDIINNKNSNVHLNSVFKFSKLEQENENLTYNFRNAAKIKSLLLNYKGVDICLTKREAECLKLSMSGNTAKEIARLLNISPRTVETFLSNLRVKSNFLSKTEIRNLYLENIEKISLLT